MNTMVENEVGQFVVGADGLGTGRGRSTLDWERVAQECRDNAGLWMDLGVRKVSLANSIRQGSVKWLLSVNGFQVSTTENVRTPGKRTCRVFLRYTAERDKSLTDEQRERAMAREEKRINRKKIEEKN